MIFLRKEEVLKYQALLIERYGGIHGIRDEGALESALAAAENRNFYENVDAATCAATYAYHLSQAHAFLDGNKRIAAAMAELFLSGNDLQVLSPDDEMEKLILGIASGQTSRDEVERFFAQRIAPLS
jgi:death-on-curing protein